MFETLTEKLQRAFKNLRGQGKLSEEHLDAALSEIRESLLDADVNLGVAEEFIGHVREKALGSEVLLQLSPDQQVVKIVRDELGDLLGREARPQFSSRPPSVWLICGLQGSGKTTSTGKLGKWLGEHGHRPIVVSTLLTFIVQRRASNLRRWPKQRAHPYGREPERTSRLKLSGAPPGKRSFPHAT